MDAQRLVDRVLRRHSRGSRALLDRVREVGRSTPPEVFTGDDAVHLDFHPGNVLAVPGSPDQVAGVEDSTGAQAGDCGLDLVTLGFALDHDGASPAARAEVLERVPAEADPLATTILRYMPRVARVVARRGLRDGSGDTATWRSRPISDRVGAVELLRQAHHGWTDATRPRLQRVLRVLARP